MKKLLIIFLAITLYGCDKSDEPGCVGVDCLPPVTQTGAGTFGCLVNGVPFIDNSGNFNCFYQLVDGEYFFNITAAFPNKKPLSISLATNALQLNENSTYLLYDRNSNNFYAEVTFDNDPPTFLNDNTTDIYNSGSVTITNLDFSRNVISATFDFEILDEKNMTIYTITDGRFDAIFIQ